MTHDQATQEILATIIQRGNSSFAEVTLSEEHFNWYEQQLLLAVLQYMYDMDIEVTPNSVCSVLAASYSDFEPEELKKTGTGEEALEAVFDNLNDLIEFECHTTMALSALCDLVLKQFQLNQSNVSTKNDGEHLEDGGQPRGRSMKLTGMRGYIKLHRQLLEHGWLRNQKLLTLWIYLLLKATHTRHKARVDVNRNGAMMTVEVPLEPGQLIFGRKVAARETGMSEQNVRTLMANLTRHGSISVEPTNSFSIVTITNWKYYQHDH